MCVPCLILHRALNAAASKEGEVKTEEVGRKEEIDRAEEGGPTGEEQEAGVEGVGAEVGVEEEVEENRGEPQQPEVAIVFSPQWYSLLYYASIFRRSHSHPLNWWWTLYHFQQPMSPT